MKPPGGTRSASSSGVWRNSSSVKSNRVGDITASQNSGRFQQLTNPALKHSNLRGKIFCGCHHRRNILKAFNPIVQGGLDGGCSTGDIGAGAESGTLSKLCTFRHILKSNGSKFCIS